MAKAEFGTQLVTVETINHGFIITSDEPVHMVDNVVFYTRTGERRIKSPQDFGIFDRNLNIGDSRAETVPHGTPRLRLRTPRPNAV